jgi:acetylornithine deacetylase/succinyl-diaminopimelate desuccinylase-like protein
MHDRGEMASDAKRLLLELIALPSVNPAFLPAGDERAGEWRVAELLANRAANGGLTVEYQEVFGRPGSADKSTVSGHGASRPASPYPRSNVIVRMEPRRRATRRVILAPHMDTVSAEEFKPRLENGRIVGRGACDTKGSVAAMFTAFLSVAESGARPQETEILFLALVDEENGQEGSRAFARSKLKGDLAIIGEPSELKVVTAHKGDLWLKLVTHGRAAHGARPELGDNAVHQMARVIDLLETKYQKTLKKKRHAILGNPTINVGAVRGGTQPNIVPDRCEIQIDRRTIPGEKDSAVQREIVEFVRAAGLRVELLNSKTAPCMPLETNPRLPLVQELMRLCRQTDPAGVDFFSDAAIIAAGGTPSVVFGPGNIAQAHTINEWISIRSLERATTILTRFLRGLP